MMMSLGEFVFGLPTWAPQDFGRDNDYRFGVTSRVGARAAAQYLGPGDETISLAGDLFPDIAGDVGSFETLKAMADTGKAWPLVNGRGEVLGNFVITSASERRANLDAVGDGRKYDFQLKLLRVDDTPADQAGASAEDPAA